MLTAAKNQLDVQAAFPQSMRTLAVLGVGGNTGSHFAAHAARMSWNHVRLLDQGYYEMKNLASQAIVPSDVGKPKASVQKRRMRRINPQLRVESITSRLEDTPLAQWRADLCVCCFDSRRARLVWNQRAWRLGVPWIDIAVSATGSLARVNVYVPGSRHAACFECDWDDPDYEAVEQEYPCIVGKQDALPTNAPASLGAIAAGLAAIECEKMLAGEWSSVLAGKQYLLDLQNHTHTTTTYRRNPRCRFDHAIWEIEPLVHLPTMLTLAGFLQFVGADVAAAETTLRLEGFRFARRLYCGTCHAVGEPTLCVAERLGRRHRCPCCRTPLAARGFEMADRVPVANLGRRHLRRSLASLGFRAGDVVSVGTRADERHFELGCGESDQQHGGPRVSGHAGVSPATLGGKS